MVVGRGASRRSGWSATTWDPDECTEEDRTRTICPPLRASSMDVWTLSLASRDRKRGLVGGQQDAWISSGATVRSVSARAAAFARATAAGCPLESGDGFGSSAAVRSLGLARSRASSRGRRRPPEAPPRRDGPLERPSRSGSTTVVCSTSTRVTVPSRVISGRKLAARARVEVGDTSTVLSARNSSAWTTTACRAPRCS